MPLPPITPKHPIRNRAHEKRITVLQDTVTKFTDPEYTKKVVTQATINLTSWAKSAQIDSNPRVIVIEEDWGIATQKLTAKYGKIFAVLNMANANRPGGGCDDGMIAQEENMYRRTNCRLEIPDHEIIGREYTTATRDLINGVDGSGKVAFDKTPRYCIKGPETREGDGYELLSDDKIFPFLELRAAAQDLRPQPGSDLHKTFDENLARKKIAAQLETLIANQQRHVVLSAFGCGAFLNPPEIIARLYREELTIRAKHFDVVVFAVYYAGYGPRINFDVFDKEFREHPVLLNTTALSPAAASPAAAATPATSISAPAILQKRPVTQSSPYKQKKYYITAGIIVVLGIIIISGLALYLIPAVVTLLSTALINVFVSFSSWVAANAAILLFTALTTICLIGLSPLISKFVSTSKTQPSFAATAIPIEPKVPIYKRSGISSDAIIQADPSQALKSVMSKSPTGPTLNWVKDRDESKTTRVAMISFERSAYTREEISHYAKQFDLQGASIIIVNEGSSGGHEAWNIYLGESRLQALAKGSSEGSKLAATWLKKLEEERAATRSARANKEASLLGLERQPPHRKHGQR